MSESYLQSVLFMGMSRRQDGLEVIKRILHPFSPTILRRRGFFCPPPLMVGTVVAKMKAFSTLWAALSTRRKLRFATAGIASVAEEIMDLSSAERIALFAAVDAVDAPEVLMRRTALIRAYINTNLGGIPEERALEVELEVLIGLDSITLSGSASVTPAVQSVVTPRMMPTSPIPCPVAVSLAKTSDRARDEAHENALAEANADTPVRKPERIVPRPIVAEKRNGVSLEAHKRLREAHVVMSVTALDGLLRENRCFITGKRFREGDKITLVNHKLLARYELVRDFGRGNGWSWISILLAKDCLVDWERFVDGVLTEKAAEVRLALLHERLETEKDCCHSIDECGGDDDLTIAYFWRHLLRVAIMMEDRDMKKAAADAEQTKRYADEEAARKKASEDRALRAEEAAKAREAWESELRTLFTTRTLIKARQKDISARHVEIKVKLEGLYEASVMDAAEKTSLIATLKAEREKIGMEFQIISGLWPELPSDDCGEGQPTFTVRDLALKVPVVRNLGKTARKKARRNSGGLR